MRGRDPSRKNGKSTPQIWRGDGSCASCDGAGEDGVPPRRYRAVALASLRSWCGKGDGAGPGGRLVDRGDTRGPAHAKVAGRMGVRVAEENGRARLRVVAGARGDVARLRRAVG